MDLCPDWCPDQYASDGHVPQARQSISGPESNLHDPEYIGILAWHIGWLLLFVLFHHWCIHSHSRGRRFHDDSNFSIYADTRRHPDFCDCRLLGVYNGIETMGRSSELLIPVGIVFILVLCFCLLPKIDTSNLKPIMDTDVVSITQGILVSVIYPVGECIPILMLLPYTSRQRHRNRDIIMAAGLGNLVLASLVTISILVLGHF
ncbi:GerAB/ArcD/ProY family transporter [Paenibacillus sp. PCH8]|uniref:GerAB/ArcD/ProY family transporter n=1 Tax=Paenibacillus sp. PCH8 TaxID=2066524 RepID=UPI0035BE2FC3